LHIENLQMLISQAEKWIDFDYLIDELRVVASNIKNNQIVQIIDDALIKSRILNMNNATAKLLELRVKQEFHLTEKIDELSKYTDEMVKLATEGDCKGNLALSYTTKWGIEKLKGNKETSNEALTKAKEFTEKLKSKDYSYYICTYSFVINDWFENHDLKNTDKLEECSDYFLKNGYFRSFAQTLTILAIIFATMQNGNRILDRCRQIFENKNLFEELPLDVKGFSYYLTGLGYMMKMNLNFAESLFQKAYDILKPIHKNSIYFSNFIILHSHLITVKALQGKIEQTWRIVKEVEELLAQEFFTKNLDLNTKNQIRHTLNLNKFYVCTRSKDFDSEEMQDLIEDLFVTSKTQYSNFMLLSEYILNSNLESDKLKELLATDNFNINRVKHIISYVLLSRTEQNSTNKLFLERIEILVKREKTEITTFIENVLADLLIAQQLFSLTRYGDIYSLLVKYKNQLNRIEVLEMRVFMEAFIQVGAYKTGDPLGPALQYMAIKKCRQYGFSRLENKLLEYLNIQGIDALRMMV